MGVKQEIIEAVDPLQFWQSEFPDWSGNPQDAVLCPLGDKHASGQDTIPSLSINPSTGEFFCYGCGLKGTSVVGYWHDVYGNGNFRRTLAQLYTRYIGQLVGKDEIDGWRSALLDRRKLLQQLTARRGWTQPTIQKLKLGWDTDKLRVTIPIYNRAGLCLDVKFHDTLKLAPKRKGRRLSLLSRSKQSGGRTADWFPINPAYNPFDVNHKEIWLAEGEPDAITLLQEGFNVITITGGVGAWTRLDNEKLSRFSDRDIVICFDKDEPGRNAARELADRLPGAGVSSVKIVEVPEGGDAGEFFHLHGGTKDYLRQCASLSSYAYRAAKRVVSVVPLVETGAAKHISSYLQTDVLINGKHYTPHAIPKRIEFSCIGDLCQACPCKGDGKAEYVVSNESPDLLEWLYVKDRARLIKEDLGLPPGCKQTIRVNEWQNLEQLTLIPALTKSSEQNKNSYCQRAGYYAGFGLESNRSYRATVMPVVHPRTKESSLMVLDARGAHDSIHNFQLSQPEIDNLRSLFSDNPIKDLRSIAEFHAGHTHIVERWDLHTVVDLAFHSPRQFTFNGVSLPKSALEILVFGDTRCGKGQVAEGLVRFYDLGEVVSGENSSFMGICGGAAKVGDSFQLVWGAVPLNHGRLVVLDEFGDLDSDTVSRLSRLRSEGVAEINKGGISARTEAQTRLVCLANCKDGRQVASFASGIQALAELITKHEDIARFDLALVVRKGEVSLETINRSVNGEKRSDRYTQAQLRKVLLWVWSRKPEQVRFTRDAVATILEGAIALSERYSATIPLVQGENARFKLAKIAAAIAGRCLSTPDGHQLIIRNRHAKAAISLITYLYDKPVMGYRTYSLIEQQTADLKNVDHLDRWLGNFAQDKKLLILNGMLERAEITITDMMDWTDQDAQISQKFFGTLVRCHALANLGGRRYEKKPAFIRWLKLTKKKLQELTNE